MAWIVLNGQGPGYIETELAIGNTAGGDRR